MLGSDGGIFTFGVAELHGSVPQFVPLADLDAPLVGIAPDPDAPGQTLGSRRLRYLTVAVAAVRCAPGE